MDAIPPAVSPKPPTQILIPKPGMAEDQKSAQDADAKYQEIFYCKRRIWEKGPRDPNELKPIDLRAALDETLSLSNADPDMKSNAYSSIVFYNQQNLNAIDILRMGDDLWQFEAPVFCEDIHCNHTYYAQSDTKRLVDTIRVFFEGGDWYGMVRFQLDHDLFKYNVTGEWPTKGFTPLPGERSA